MGRCTHPEAVRQSLAVWASLAANRMGLGPGRLLLDVGSGGPEFAQALREVCSCRVACVDLRPSAVEPTVPWVCADAERLPFRDETVDAVFASHLLHHLGRPVLFLREAARVLCSGGYLGVRCASHRQIRARLACRLFPEVGERACRAAPDVPEIISMLAQCGLVDVRTEDVVELAAPTVSAVLESIRSGALPGPVPVRADDVLRAIEHLEARIALEGPGAREEERLTFITARKP